MLDGRQHPLTYIPYIETETHPVSIIGQAEAFYDLPRVHGATPMCSRIGFEPIFPDFRATYTYLLVDREWVWCRAHTYLSVRQSLVFNPAFLSQQENEYR